MLASLLYYWVTVCKTVCPMPSDRCLSCLSVCLSVLTVTLLYCDQTVGWIKTKLDMQVGLGPSHIVLDEDPAPPPPKGCSPQFSAHICCGQTTGWTKTLLGRDVGIGSGDIVLDGDPVPLHKTGPSLNSNTSATCLHNMVNFCLLAVEICWRV